MMNARSIFASVVFLLSPNDAFRITSKPSSLKEEVKEAKAEAKANAEPIAKAEPKAEPKPETKAKCSTAFQLHGGGLSGLTKCDAGKVVSSGDCAGEGCGQSSDKTTCCQAKAKESDGKDHISMRKVLLAASITIFTLMACTVITWAALKKKRGYPGTVENPEEHPPAAVAERDSRLSALTTSMLKKKSAVPGSPRPNLKVAFQDDSLQVGNQSKSSNESQANSSFTIPEKQETADVDGAEEDEEPFNLFPKKE